MENSKSLIQQIKDTAKTALTTSLKAKGKAGEFNKLGFLILQAFLKGNKTEIKEVTSLFVKGAVYHELRQILSNVTPIAARLESDPSFTYIKNKAGDKITVTKEQVLNSEDDNILTISTAYRFLKNGVSASISETVAFKAWQDNVCTMSALSLMTLKDIRAAKTLMTEEEIEQAVKEGRAFLESVQAQKEAISLSNQIVTDFKAVLQASPQEAYKILQILNKEIAELEAA